MPTTSAGAERLRLEVAYLRRRAQEAGSCNFGPGRFVGTSSNAMVEHAFGGHKPRADEYPADEDDLEACRRAYRMAPKHLQTRMAKILSDYHHHVVSRIRGKA